uniref:Uncharacterized protein n=1 Tax=Candidatus Kentrum sp. MB TaxID=2138164 RepID=A0A451B8E9_9GAMM|nr:MAG: hypothetical protein BECKMB1821I_GA0114274_100110 [Candidatus Kentron sp. MB]VFK74573.1 MAG: hypothetical protein BECKMB1821H_GA0114242_100664 [Candidatus Kentron sp. MB]
MISTKRIFLLTGDTLAVYQRQAGNLVRPHVFPNNSTGLREFQNYLNEDPWTPIRFLIDVMDEEFRVETIPHVFGTDRHALVANRQRRLFRDCPYQHAVFQGRETGGRRDDTVLFSAITNPERLQDWLQPIAQRKIPLAGIHSLPILSKKLLSHLFSASVIPDYVLLIHYNIDSQLRQSFFHRQHLKVSRLAMMPRTEDPNDTIFTVQMEVENIRRYLIGLRLLPLEHPLDVYFPGNAKALIHLSQQATDAPNVRYHVTDIGKLDIGIKISDELRGHSTDPIFAGILIRSTFSNHYAPPIDTRHFRTARLRTVMYAIGVAMLIVSIIWSTLHLADILSIRQRIAVLTRQAEIYETRYAHIEANAPESPLSDGPALKSAVRTAVVLKESKTTPYEMLFALSRVLDREERLEIGEIEWSVSTDPYAPMGIPPRKSETWRKPTRPLSQPESDKNRYQIALVKGRVTTFTDYQEAIRSVEGFANALSKLDAMEQVRIIKRPVNIGSEETLVGEANMIMKEANFVVRVVLKI